MPRKNAIVLGAVCLLGVACEKPADKNERSSPPSATAAAPAPSASTAAAPASASAAPESKTVELKIASSGVTMVFDVTTFTVPAESTVHLVFENKPPGALPHNWALVQPGTEAKVAADGLAKGEAAGYIAPGPDLIAHTDMVKPGQKGDVTFRAPAPGKYPYICTFPGHYMMMKGVLTVLPP